jgi:hypothetical protein
LFPCELAEGFYQYRARDAKVFQTLFDGARQNLLALAGQFHKYASACSRPAYKIIVLGAVDQFHGAVVPASKLLRKCAYRRLNAFGKPSYRQEKLILSGFDAGRFRCLIAEIQVLADVISEFSQRTIVGIFCFPQT